MTFYFEQPLVLWALLAMMPLIGVHYWFYRNKQQALAQLGEKNFKWLTNSYNNKGWITTVIWQLTAFILLVFAWAKPTIQQVDITANYETQVGQGLDVVLVLDVSNSMQATDLKPTRLYQAKKMAAQFLNSCNNNRVALIVFAGDAYLQMPLSTDLAAAQLLLSAVESDIATTQGTNFPAALQLADKCLDVKDKKHTAVVVISDGENHEKGLDDVLHQFQKYETPIYTVGIGSVNGVELSETGTNTPKKDLDGNIVVAKLSESTLQNISQQTHGQYFHFENPDITARNLTKALAQLDKKTLAIPDSAKSGLAYWLMIGAAMCLMIDLMINYLKMKFKYWINV